MATYSEIAREVLNNGLVGDMSAAEVNMRLIEYQREVARDALISQPKTSTTASRKVKPPIDTKCNNYEDHDEYGDHSSNSDSNGSSDSSDSNSSSSSADSLELNEETLMSAFLGSDSDDMDVLGRKTAGLKVESNDGDDRDIRIMSIIKSAGFLKTVPCQNAYGILKVKSATTIDFLHETVRGGMSRNLLRCILLHPALFPSSWNKLESGQPLDRAIGLKDLADSFRRIKGCTLPECDDRFCWNLETMYHPEDVFLSLYHYNEEITTSEGVNSFEIHLCQSE